MQTTSRIHLTIDGLPYPVLFILDWGNPDTCPLFEEDRQAVHRHLEKCFRERKHDTVPGHTVMIEVRP